MRGRKIILIVTQGLLKGLCSLTVTYEPTENHAALGVEVRQIREFFYCLISKYKHLLI